MKRVRNAFFALVLLSAALLIAFLAAEALVRVVRPQQLVNHRPDVYQPMDTIGFGHRPNVRTTINTGERTVDLFTDRDGYRIGAGGRREAATRVLILGDSFMQALQVEYERSVAGRLESELLTRTGEQVAVRNAAVSDWQPSQYLLQLERSLAREHFTLVVVGFFVSNDVVGRRVDHFDPRPYSPVRPLRIPRGLGVGEMRDAVLVPLSDYLAARSHLFVMVKKRTKTIRIMLGLSRAEVPNGLLTDFQDSPEWTVSADICQRIADVATAGGARTVFLLIPAVEQVDRQMFDDFTRAFAVDTSRIDLDQPNRILKDELESRGLEVIDLLPLMREAHGTGGRLYGRVDWHFTPRGHAIVASHLLPVAAERLLEADSARSSEPTNGD